MIDKMFSYNPRVVENHPEVMAYVVNQGLSFQLVTPFNLEEVREIPNGSLDLLVVDYGVSKEDINQLVSKTRRQYGKV